MPRPTFFALPAERRDRLVREAIAEFSERSYADASLSQIAQRSRIPKGSFYQYFDDKVFTGGSSPTRRRATSGRSWPPPRRRATSGATSRSSSSEAWPSSSSTLAWLG
jgi:hypothetical protein